mgnify:CR=1 FL=1
MEAFAGESQANRKYLAYVIRLLPGNRRRQETGISKKFLKPLTKQNLVCYNSNER